MRFTPTLGQLATSALLVLICSLSFDRSLAVAAERIERFQSDITVHTDGRLAVTETIVVHTEQDQIKRGIFRDFPTLYKKRFGIMVQVPFTVKQVLRDGRAEPYHLEHRANGVRVYIGAESVLLPSDQYTYTIEYETNFQLGFFAEYDEIYWNVTGNGWAFPIETAVANVTLPDSLAAELSQLKTNSYTGPQGSTENNAKAEIDPLQPRVRFTSTSPLPPQAGMTVVVAFPKGHVSPPSPADLRQLYWPAIQTLIVALVSLAIVWMYYFWAWWNVGRDPPGGVVIPLFEPPAGLSPACVRFLRNLGYDRKCFAAAMINLAVQERIRIEEDKGEFSIRPLEGSTSALLPTDRALANVFAGRKTSIVLEQRNHAVLRKAIDAVRKHLTSEYEGKLFFKNRMWLIPGWLLSLVAVLVTVASVSGKGLAVGFFMLVWGTIWTTGCLFLGAAALSQWRAFFASRSSLLIRGQALIQALFITAFCVPFFFAEIVALVIFTGEVGITVPLLLLLLAITAYLFWHWIKQPTVEGQRLRDAIEGFRMYLGTAEGEYLQAMHPPEKTPELFERLLPYAVALDVENQWGEKFHDVLAQAATEPVTQGGAVQASYSPRWYSGSSYQQLAAGAFASSLASSMGAAIASSATAPGSRSGSSGGGGGSSGGGGGGGGGGGW